MSAPPLLGLPPAAELRGRGARLRVAQPRETLFAEGDGGESLFLLLPAEAGATPPLVALLAGSGSRAGLAVDLAREGDVVGEIEPLRRMGALVHRCG